MESNIKNKKLLIVDDEPKLLKLIVSVLEADGYHSIVTASTVASAKSALERERPALAILDVMLPDGDGFHLMQDIRAASDIPVLFLTARGDAEDRFRGFGLGADDYIIKPFLSKELLFRIYAVLRRTYKENAVELSLEACTVDLEKAEVYKNGTTIPLTAKEHDILSALFSNAGKIVTIDSILQSVWGDAYYGYENTLMGHIRRIREKIESDPSKPVL